MGQFSCLGYLTIPQTGVGHIRTVPTWNSSRFRVFFPSLLPVWSSTWFSEPCNQIAWGIHFLNPVWFPTMYKPYDSQWWPMSRAPHQNERSLYDKTDGRRERCCSLVMMLGLLEWQLIVVEKDGETILVYVIGFAQKWGGKKDEKHLHFERRWCFDEDWILGALF